MLLTRKLRLNISNEIKIVYSTWWHKWHNCVHLNVISNFRRTAAGITVITAARYHCPSARSSIHNLDGFIAVRITFYVFRGYISVHGRNRERMFARNCLTERRSLFGLSLLKVIVLRWSELGGSTTVSTLSTVRRCVTLYGIN